MSHMSNYLENKLIDHLFRDTAFTKPSTLAIALLTSAPNDASTGATITEVTNANNYSRKTLNASLANWAPSETGSGTAPSSGTGGGTSNNGAIAFDTPSGAWGTITHFAILDSAAWGAGNVLFWAPLTASRVITTNDTVNFAAGSITVQLDN